MIRIGRRALLAASLLTPLAAGAEETPDAPIAALNAGISAVMHAGKDVPFAERVRMLRPKVVQAFSLLMILRNSVGVGKWRVFTVDQQSQLMDAFIEFTVATWVANFDSYDGEVFQILPERRQVADDEIVQTRIVARNGEVTRLDYVMRNLDGHWRAIDILLDGTISRVAVQRSDFREVLKAGDPASLIALLKEKTANLAAGIKS